jgi:hypothetical protein
MSSEPMSDESKFWLGINVAFLTAVVLVVYLITSYWKDHNEKVVGMIKLGISPAGVMCAMQDSYGNNPTCVLLASKALPDYDVDYE